MVGAEEGGQAAARPAAAGPAAAHTQRGSPAATAGTQLRRSGGRSRSGRQRQGVQQRRQQQGQEAQRGQQQEQEAQEAQQGQQRQRTSGRMCLMLAALTLLTRPLMDLRSASQVMRWYCGTGAVHVQNGRRCG